MPQQSTIRPSRIARSALAFASSALALSLALGSAGARAQAAASALAPAVAASASNAPVTTADAVALAESLGVHAVRLAPGERIAIDGRLDAPAWQRAPAFDQFVQKDPVYGAQPKYATRVQVLFDDAALYVGVTSLDDHPEEIRAPLVRHDNVNRTQDFVVVYVDAIGKRGAAQFFRVNAAGSTADGLHTGADDNEDFSPDFDFDAAAHRDERGWTAVFRIPFSSLRFSSDPKAVWRIMVGRRLPREQTYLFMSTPIPLDAASFIATMQPLKDLQPPEHPSFLIVRPSVTVRQTRTGDLGAPSERQRAVDPSLDVKWHPTPDIVVDGTWRPDFSQVALDVPQLSGNSAFALNLPEKRPFFFESADVLRSPSDALYTRSFTSPQWGVRGTWRDQRGAGVAMFIDDRGGGTTLVPGPYYTSTAAQPPSRSFTLRVRGDADPGTGLELGMLTSMRRYEQSGGENDVIGPDFTWQATPSLKLRGQWLHSETTSLPVWDDSISNNRLTTGPDRPGDYAVLRVVNQTERTNIDGSFASSSAGFRHDSGFFNQVGVHQLDLHQGFAWRELGPINELWLNFNESHVVDRATGDTVFDMLAPGVWMAGPRNTQAFVQWHPVSRLRTDLGQPLIGEHYWHLEYSTTLARWAPQLNVNADVGRMVDYYSGRIRPGWGTTASLMTRPLPFLELEPRVSYATLKDGGLPVYREVASQLLGVWHLDAKQNLRVILQRYTYDHKDDAGGFGAKESSLTASVTYAYRRSAGTVLYVGWTNGHVLDCPGASLHHAYGGACRDGVGGPGFDGSLARSSELFVKLQADFDEVKRFF